MRVDYMCPPTSVTCLLSSMPWVVVISYGAHSPLANSFWTLPPRMSKTCLAIDRALTPSSSSLFRESQSTSCSWETYTGQPKRQRWRPLTWRKHFTWCKMCQRGPTMPWRSAWYMDMRATSTQVDRLCCRWAGHMTQELSQVYMIFQSHNFSMYSCTSHDIIMTLCSHVHVVNPLRMSSRCLRGLGGQGPSATFSSWNSDWSSPRKRVMMECTCTKTPWRFTTWP